ncbi:MAG: Signal transduction histidine-protein kinase BarA [Luteibacter sp.]|uniref:hybrid sensor histidine kinase/response regulator n=1 Tax=Luteibacter sp. TaxID=1886636 RepID=UPI0013862591|nr:hybrid sensor histidine kinase/response regulator [Luteibacter sp.]KAF1004475.1 MAG: Signal transduction histidine-protein kinase BarA [Luteibacter sp.]
MRPERLLAARWRWLGLVLCLWSWMACAAVQLPLTAYDQSNGLTSLSIVRMVQDRDGFVWAGTEKGLYRFDGVGFTAVGADDGFQTSEVIAFAEDSTAHLWVASRAGIQRRDREGRFQWVRPQGHLLLADRGQTLAVDEDGGMFVLSGHRLLHLRRDAGNAWQAAPMFDEAFVRRERGLDQVSAVFHRDGVTWFGCGDALCRFAAGKLTRYGAERGVPLDRWLGFLHARDGSLWVRGIHSIRRLAPGAEAFESRDMPDGHARVAASSLDLIEDHEGRILTRSDTGLGRWDGTRWERFDTGNGLPGVGVSVLMADRDGMVWMGTYGRGVLYWNSADAVENWTAAQGLNDSLIWSIARADRQSIWVASESGGEVIVPSAGRAHRWPLDVAAPNQAHAVLVDRQGRPWYFLFDGRVVRYRPDTGRTEPMATLPYLIRGALLDREGRIWVYTLGGPYAIDPEHGDATRVAPDLVPSTMCSDMAEDPQGRLWLACSTGLYRNNARGWAKVAVQPEEALGGYENVTVTPDGRLWLSALQPGLFVGRVTDADAVDVETVDDPLLADTRFYFLRPDRDGRLWAGGGNGVDVLHDGHWTRLSARDGLLWDETNHGAFLADDDGTVWIGAPVGLTHVLKPAQLLASRVLTPRVVSMHYGDLDAGPGAFSAPFEHGAALVMRFGVIGNSAGNPVRFRYRLSGVDQDWVETSQAEVRYAALPSGSYRFDVQAVDVHRRTISETVTRTLRIAPPWWFSPWVAMGAALLVVGLVVLAWRWRVAVLIHHARRLEGMVAERTAELQQSLRTRSMLLAHIGHDLRSPLGAILDSVRQWRAGWGDRDHPQLIERHVRQQMSLIDELLEFSRGELVELELEPVAGYLHGFLHEVAESASLLAERQRNQLGFVYGDELPAVVVADFHRLRQVLLNVLGNAAKFTHDGRVDFRVAVASIDAARVHLHIAVQDSGIGLDPDVSDRLAHPFARGGNVGRHEGHGLGLSIVSQLLAKMDSHLDAAAGPEGGTVFAFDLVLPLAVEADVESVFTPGEVSWDGDGEGRAILVVEGQADKRDMLCDLLDGFGFVTSAVEDGIRASARMQEEVPDLVVTTESTAWTWLAEVRREWPGLPVMLLSSRPSRPPEGLAFDAELLKPVDAGHFLTLIGSLARSPLAKITPAE